jgi:hypothetical protein
MINAIMPPNSNGIFRFAQADGGSCGVYPCVGKLGWLTLLLLPSV